MIRYAYIIDGDSFVAAELATFSEHAGFAVKHYGSMRRFGAAMATLPPGVAMIEMTLPDGDGLALIERLRTEACPHVPVGMSATGGVSLAVEAMRAGAFHYLEKPIQMVRLTAVLHEASLKLSQSRSVQHRRQSARSMIDSLTPRQRQILRGMVDGLRNEEIAQTMGLTRRTVETYRHSMLERLQVGSSLDAVKMAVEGGISNWASDAPA